MNNTAPVADASYVSLARELVETGTLPGVVLQVAGIRGASSCQIKGVRQIQPVNSGGMLFRFTCTDMGGAQRYSASVYPDGTVFRKQR